MEYVHAKNIIREIELFTFFQLFSLTHCIDSMHRRRDVVPNPTVRYQL